MRRAGAAFPSACFAPAFLASRERAPEARHKPGNPMREHGEIERHKRKRASERRHNFFSFPRLCVFSAEKFSRKISDLPPLLICYTFSEVPS